MRRGVVAADRGIEAAANDLSIFDDHRADRNLACRLRLARLDQCRQHECLVYSHSLAIALLCVGSALSGYSHSMVAGGLPQMS